MSLLHSPTQADTPTSPIPNTQATPPTDVYPALTDDTTARLNGLRYTSSIDGMSEFTRILGFFPERVMVTDAGRLLLSDGVFWYEVDTSSGVRPTIAGLLVSDARREAMVSARDAGVSGPEIEALTVSLQKPFTTRQWREVAQQGDLIATFPYRYGLIPTREHNVDRFERCPYYLIRPTPSNPRHYWDCRTGTVQPVENLAGRLLVDHHWEVDFDPTDDLYLKLEAEMPGDPAGWCVFKECRNIQGMDQWDVRGQSQDPRIEGAQLARWLLHSQIGTDFARRIAYLLLFPLKEHLDILIMPPNRGKSTLGDLLEAVMGTAVRLMNVRGVENTNQFSNGLNLLVLIRLLIIDEIDKAKSDLPTNMVNELGDTSLVIHNKGKDSVIKRRLANIVLFGNDYPNITFGEGVMERLGGAYIGAPGAVPITSETHNRIVKDESAQGAIEYTASWLLHTMSGMLQSGDTGVTQEAKERLQEWRSKSQDEAITVLLTTYEEVDDPTAFVPYSSVKATLDEAGVEYSKTKGLKQLVTGVFKNTTSGRVSIGGKQERGVLGLALIAGSGSLQDTLQAMTHSLADQPLPVENQVTPAVPPTSSPAWQSLVGGWLVASPDGRVAYAELQDRLVSVGVVGVSSREIAPAVTAVFPETTAGVANITYTTADGVKKRSRGVGGVAFRCLDNPANETP